MVLFVSVSRIVFTHLQFINGISLFRNYATKLQLLLHMEQVEEEKEVRHLDMMGIELKVERQTGLVVVDVPHLQEGRLDTLRGDKLFLRRAGDRVVEFEAYVHKVSWWCFYLLKMLLSGDGHQSLVGRGCTTASEDCPWLKMGREVLGESAPSKVEASRSHSCLKPWHGH